jgi:hypothetical protein
VSKAAEVLEAGGMITTAAERPPAGDYPLDPVEARSYSHPGLGEPVIRLSLAPLAAATDAEMAVLGFDPGASLGEVGVTRRRGLGFPGAAIVSDPDNARYALEVVQDLAKAARRARSKPGHAKEAIDKIGERLGKSVPHFLPSFYEEASRVFLDCGNTGYAGQLFEKAREAERVHALEVDEQHRENTFVEFALAGALSVKSLSSYARELAGASEPADAYAVFRRVCVRRTLGGLPPWAKMAAELRRLIKAAGLDIAAEEMTLLAEIIDAPALNKAQAGFWKSYKKSLAKMCAESPATRGQLLALFPADVDTGEWLELLDACGALEGVLDPDAAPETRSASGAAGWFARLAASCGGWRSDLPPRALELLEQAAPVLKKEGKPLALFARWGDCDLDMIELAMSLELPLADPQEHSDFDDLERWASRVDEHEMFGRDPIRVAADPRYARLLGQAMERELGSEPFTSLALTMDGFGGAIGAWLSDQIDRLKGEVGLPGLHDILDTLGNPGLRPVWAKFPEQRARLEATRVHAPLALTLRAGIYDEHRWPAFDEALGKLADNAEVKLGGAFPHLVVSDGIKALVVGPTSIVAEIDLALPKDADLEGFRWVQDQLLVIFEPSDTWRSYGYWSGNPTEIFELEGSFYSYGPSNERGVVLDDGAVVFASATMTAGDRKVGSDAVACDGESFWAVDYDGMRELDPRTGKRGRKSAPAFVAEYARDGSEIIWGACSLYPLPPEITASPLGQRGALTGKRVRHRDEQSPAAGSAPMSEVERIDGVSWSLAGEYETPDVLMTFPGDDAPRPIEAGYGARIVAPGDGYVAASADHPQYRRGSRMLPPVVFWHYLVPRDVDGSKALRALSDDGAAALLAAAELDLAKSDGKTDSEGLLVFEIDGSALDAAIDAALPQMTDAALRIGVAHLALLAARDQQRLGRIADLSATAGSEEAPSAAADPKGLSDAVRDVAYIYEGQSNLAELAWVSELLAAAAAEADGVERRVFPEAPGADCDWLILVANAGRLAYRAALQATPDDQRLALGALLEATARSWILEHLGELRFIDVEGSIAQGAGEDQGFLFTEGGNVYFGWNTWDDNYKLLEWAPSGEHRDPDGAIKSVDEETRYEQGPLDAAALRAFAERLAEDGPVDIIPLAPRLSEATGLTETEALWVLAGSPRDIDGLAKELGVKKARLELAVDGARVSDDHISAIFGAALAADPLSLWDDPGAFVDRIAAAWIERLGRYAPLDEDFLEATAKELKALDNVPATLRAIADPGRGVLATDQTYRLTEKANVVAEGDTGRAFDEHQLEQLLPMIAHLFLDVEVGHPIRSKIPEAVSAIGARLAAPGMYLSMPDLDFEDSDKRAAYLADFGGEPVEGHPESRERDGVRLVPDDYDALEVWVRPQAFREHPALIASLLPQLGWTPDWVGQLELFYNGVLDRFAARVADTPVPTGELECNPIHSAPEIVAEVGSELDLDQNAAALYLQLAALPAPRDKSVRAWNRWKPAAHKAAAKKLVDRGLVIEAKRSRAGRSHFVPGGWEPFKNPLLPIETWKLGLYGIEIRDGSIRAPLGQILPSAPVHEVFAEAWRRIKAGEGPAYLSTNEV